MNNVSNKISKCPVCGQTGTLKLSFPQPFHGNNFSLHTCNACSLCYTFPQTSEKILREIYTGEYWTKESVILKLGVIARLVHKFNEVRLAATVRPLLRLLPTGASILEVGCGAGQLAAYLKRKGHNVEVTDFSQDILDEIKNLYGINGYCGNLSDICFTRVYDGIIFNNVLEHIPGPIDTLIKAKQLLAPRGLVFLEVPNIASVQFRLFQKNWFPLQIPEHLFHFSPQSLENMTHQASLEKIWLSTFSPRASAAGYTVSLFPVLRPEKIRKSWSKAKLFLYLGLQTIFLPLAFAEAMAGMGSAIRVIYQKELTRI